MATYIKELEDGHVYFTGSELRCDSGVAESDRESEDDNYTDYPKGYYLCVNTSEQWRGGKVLYHIGEFNNKRFMLDGTMIPSCYLPEDFFLHDMTINTNVVDGFHAGTVVDIDKDSNRVIMCTVMDRDRDWVQFVNHDLDRLVNVDLLKVNSRFEIEYKDGKGNVTALEPFFEHGISHNSFGDPLMPDNTVWKLSEEKFDAWHNAVCASDKILQQFHNEVVAEYDFLKGNDKLAAFGNKILKKAEEILIEGEKPLYGSLSHFQGAFWLLDDLYHSPEVFQNCSYKEKLIDDDNCFTHFMNAFCGGRQSMEQLFNSFEPYDYEALFDEQGFRIEKQYNAAPKIEKDKHWYGVYLTDDNNNVVDFDAPVPGYIGNNRFSVDPESMSKLDKDGVFAAACDACFNAFAQVDFNRFYDKEKYCPKWITVNEDLKRDVFCLPFDKMPNVLEHYEQMETKGLLCEILDLRETDKAVMCAFAAERHTFGLDEMVLPDNLGDEDMSYFSHNSAIEINSSCMPKMYYLLDILSQRADFWENSTFDCCDLLNGENEERCSLLKQFYEDDYIDSWCRGDGDVVYQSLTKIFEHYDDLSVMLREANEKMEGKETEKAKEEEYER